MKNFLPASVLFLLPVALGPACVLAKEASDLVPDRLEAVPDARAEVGRVLDAFLRAASEADGETYFGLLAPDAVFLGTDATERWTKAEFEAYCRPYFDDGVGWTYVPVERHVRVHRDVAWVDELQTSEKYGRCRGTAVLRRADGRWLIEHYSLTFLVPNDVAADVVAVVREFEGS